MTTGAALVAALQVALQVPGADRGGAAALLSVQAPAPLVAAAQHHGTLPALHVALEGVEGVAPDLLSAASAGYHAGIRTHLHAIDGLRLLHGALDGVTSWLVIKGPVLSGFVHRRPDLRRYVDLDVLVPPARFEAALDALLASGCALADRNWALLRDQVPGELRVMLPSGLWVDLHWHLLNRSTVRSAFTLDTDPLIARSRSVELAGLATPVRTLDAADTFLHLALHACLSGGDRLSWAADLHEAVANDRPPWDEVVRRAERAGTSAAVAAMVRRADAAVPTGVPPEVLRRLGPAAPWRVVTGVADRLVPLADSSGRPSPARAVLRSTRATTASSAAELARRATGWVAGGARRERRSPDRDPTSPASFLHAAGGAPARRAYFEAVRTAGARPSDAQGSARSVARS